MVLKINNESVSILKGKRNKGFIVLTDEQTQNKTIQGFGNSFIAKINTTIEQCFTVNGLTINAYNVKAVGSYSNLTVRLYNTENNHLTYVSHGDLVNGSYLNNEKIPQYIKNVIGTLVIKMNNNGVKKQSVINELKPIFNQDIAPKKAIEVLSLICPLNNQIKPITSCWLCNNSTMSNKSEIVIKYHNFNKNKNHKVINEIAEFNAFIKSLTDAEREQLKTIYCRINQ